MLNAVEAAAFAVEFAIIAPTLMVVMTGLGDFAHASYVKSVLQGAVHKAARDGTLETASTNLGAIDQKVRKLVHPTINNATFSLGLVLDALVNFLAVAAVVYFLIVLPMNKIKERMAKPGEPAAPTEVELLAEIRDALRAQGGPSGDYTRPAGQ